MPTITTRDGVETFHKDWGRGQREDDQTVPMPMPGRRRPSS
jgi:hypothetical protein